MVAWPREDMARALSHYVPRAMDDHDVPGVALAVVVDGQLQFEQGFGTADLLGQEDVSANTLFQGASLGKPVTALGALSLVNRGQLTFDDALGDKLDDVWLGDGDDHDRITLRQVLSHRSGLSNFVWCCSNESWSEPGNAFSYSGVGYMYLEHVVAQVTEKSFARAIREEILEPYGMNSTGFVLPDMLDGSVARGFVPLRFPVFALLLPALICLAVSSLATFLVVRFGINRLKLEVRDFIPAFAFSGLLPLVAIGVLLGFWPLLAIIGYVMVSAFFLLIATLVFLMVFAFTGLLGPGDGTVTRGQADREPVMTLVAFVLAGFFGFFQLDRNVPVPAMPVSEENAAYSLRTSAHDMGVFMEQFLAGSVIGADLRDAVLEDAAPIGGQIGWGLGFGTRESTRGVTLWQWGSNPGFESLMVIDPARRNGIVVLTNSSKGTGLVQEIAGHVMGDQPGWHLP